jgi:uncharacterized damage-inducible protein DinB
MANELARQYRRWLQYEIDVHARVVHSLETVPAERRSSPEFRRAVAILAHIVAARRVWLGRLGLAPPAAGPLFPENPNLAEVIGEMQSVQKVWTEFLGRASDEDLGRTFEYQSLDAGRFRNRVEDILAQLFGHSWYHRGQIAMLVRAAGGEPAITDLIYWCREPVAAGASER